jgi:alkanesulfonate monooxygenase SsuD/methylene tetrahydromethanopterin reductase-like flavin-dependent oxidoreductase (luciferase family)
MRVNLMVEGQEDVHWDRWLELAGTCERVGIDGLFRSDHYISVEDRRERASLDAWGTICGLAASTNDLVLGTLVSPATFRHPSVLSKLVVTADQIAGPGRIELGLGVGWWEVEHRLYGFEFPSIGVRLDRLEEQLELITRQWSDGPFSFSGNHYRVSELDARPKPRQLPRLIVGGNAGPRSASLAARFADEYNTVRATPEECQERRTAIREACEAIGRNPHEMSFSVMTGFLIGADRQELLRRAGELASWRNEETVDPEGYLASLPKAWIIGSVPEAVEQLRELEAAGADRIMLQHHLHWDMDAIELIGSEVAPAVRL